MKVTQSRQRSYHHSLLSSLFLQREFTLLPFDLTLGLFLCFSGSFFLLPLQG